MVFFVNRVIRRGTYHVSNSFSHSDIPNLRFRTAVPVQWNYFPAHKNVCWVIKGVKQKGDGQGTAHIGGGGSEESDSVAYVGFSDKEAILHCGAVDGSCSHLCTTVF